MAKLKPTDVDPDAGPVMSRRFIVAVALMVLGVAWIVYYYAGARTTASGHQHGPAFFRDFGGWNYTIGFALLFIGLIVSAHPSTPLGRGRGVVTGMLACFIVGLAWIVVYYAAGNSIDNVWIFNDLGTKNLVVGIVFMAVGFAFATRWE